MPADGDPLAAIGSGHGPCRSWGRHGSNAWAHLGVNFDLTAALPQPGPMSVLVHAQVIGWMRAARTRGPPMYHTPAGLCATQFG